MVDVENLLVCTCCGTQFDVPANHPLDACRICDDPRQYVPPQGQTWTSLAQLAPEHKNKRTGNKSNPKVTSIVTEPKVGIGQCCYLLETPAGNVLWDCITLLDDDTVGFVRSKGGLKAIVISHPHFYSTHLHWARTFACPVYLAAEDAEWLVMPDPEGRRRFITNGSEEILPGVTAIKLGGHFPGSLVLLWEKQLFTADTIHAVPSALYHINRPPGTTSYSFMWSYPNQIPLPPSALHRIWMRLKPFEFESTHGIWSSSEVRDPRVKARVLESMKIQTRAMGHDVAAILNET